MKPAKKTQDSKQNVLQLIQSRVEAIKQAILEKKHPELAIPLRNLSNVEYSSQGFFEIKDKVKIRRLTAATAKTFAQTLRMIALSKQLLNQVDIATKREVYYVSKNWGDVRFNEQPESDAVMDDIEAMFRVNREQLGFIPEEDGAAIVGDLKVIDKNPLTGEEEVIDCKKMGSGGWNIPNSVERLQFEPGKVDIILAIETSSMYQRLAYHRWWKKSKALLASLRGVPSRATRRFLRRLNEEHGIPVVVFTDGDPYGWLNIYRTLKVGSGNAAHINKYFCVPKARFIGITAKDIIEYELPTHPLKEQDFKRIDDGLKNDPFVKHYKEWQQELKQLKKLKKRAEQQALASKGLNYVMSNYLPEKLSDEKKWLP
ncbi:DNA topoisomerase IV subunit A [Candidatus Woesearchaeota archaeon]|nr:DNA topoisomerase IV subunit A [Candidatus Woesearchaeota archaeon]